MEKFYVQSFIHKGLDSLNGLREFEVIYDSYNKKEFDYYNEAILAKGYEIKFKDDIGKDFEVRVVHYKETEKVSPREQDLTYFLHYLNERKLLVGRIPFVGEIIHGYVTKYK